MDKSKQIFIRKEVFDDKLGHAGQWRNPFGG